MNTRLRYTIELLGWSSAGRYLKHRNNLKMIKIEINMNTKKTDQDVIDAMQRDAFWAYLEYCNAINDVPKKEFYNTIKNCTDGEVLDKLTSVVERMHGDFERKMQRKVDVKKVGFWSRIFKF